MKITCEYCKKTFDRRSVNKNSRHFCSKLCKNLQKLKDRHDKGFTKEWFQQEYVDKERSFSDIANEIGVDPKTAWLWAKDYGIKKRKRGQNKNAWFKKGHKLRLGIKHTDETKAKISKTSKGKRPYLKNGKHWLHCDGSINPNWKGGVTCERACLYNSLEWRSVIGKVWEKCGKTCQRCGLKHDKSKPTFHIHHIIPFTEKQHRTDIDNLILLCVNCHRWVHSNDNINNDFINEESK